MLVVKLVEKQKIHSKTEGYFSITKPAKSTYFEFANTRVSKLLQQQQQRWHRSKHFNIAVKMLIHLEKMFIPRNSTIILN